MEGKPACVSFIIFIVLQQRCRTFEGLHYITISINHLKEKETTNSLNSKKVKIPTNELYHRYRRISGDWTKPSIRWELVKLIPIKGSHLSYLQQEHMTLQ